MRKKTGFTLIELLAVIVILAIIALIATPLIMNVIDEAKKGAFKDSAYGIIEAAELGYAQNILNGGNGEVTFTYTDSVESSSIEGQKLNYKGDKPQYGTISINNQGKIAIAIHNGTYCAEKGYDEEKVTLSKTIQKLCIIGPLDPITEIIIKENYIPVASADELNNIRNAAENIFGVGTEWEDTYIGGLDKKYIQVSNIDLSAYSSGEGWVPIGEKNNSFTGIYDGNNYTIDNLTITRPDGQFQGLFGYTDETSSELNNITLDNVNIEAKEYIGSLTGRIGQGTKITNSKVLNGIVIGHGSSIGGLVGYANGTIKNSHSNVEVKGIEITPDTVHFVGGLVGINYGSITNSSATGNVHNDDYATGGLVGDCSGSSSTITNSYATGDVSSGAHYTGGLVGTGFFAEIYNSYATGSVQAADQSLGGLIGSMQYGLISSCKATGSVTATSADVYAIGGLVGHLTDTSEIVNSYATSNIIANYSGNRYVGGLVGWHMRASTITNSYSIGSVTGDTSVGGLIGLDGVSGNTYYDGGAVTNSYWNTQTSGLSTSAHGIGRTTDQMTYPYDVNTYEGWDFDTVWGIESGVNNGYPYLKILQ